MEKPDLSEDALKRGFSNEGTIQGTYRPLNNIIGMWIIQECRRDWIKNGIDISWNDVVVEAQKAEPLRSIIDPDAPEFYAGGNMEKKIQDFCRNTNQPVPETVGAVARCVYESLALKYRNALEGLEAMKGQRIDSLNIVGGAINNKFLDQLIADALDREVVTGPVEGAAIGNLLTQAMALGDIKDLDALRQVVRNSESVETWTPNHTAAWDEAYETLLKLL
jgi:rhamnulokinase